MTEAALEALTKDPPGSADGVARSVRHIICPGCEARFLVDDTAFRGVEGRLVRCASCGHVWQYSPDPGSIQPAFLEEAATAKAAVVAAEPPRLTAVSSHEPGRLEPRIDAERPPSGPSALPRPYVATEPRSTARRRGAMAGIVGLAVLAAGLVFAALLGRDRIETLFASTAPVHATLRSADVPANVPGDIPGAGLKVTVTPMRSADSLVINGDIVNGATISRRVPRLRLTLLDRNKIDLDSKVINPPVAQLQPGASAHFNAIFEHPTNTAVRVDVTFATD
jgi:predicted Zn finger-like uncharacterized protein